MAMVKRGVSFQNSVVEVLDGKEAKCETCSSILNMMSSNKGVVVCSKCGHPNAVSDMEPTDE